MQISIKKYIYTICMSQIKLLYIFYCHSAKKNHSAHSLIYSLLGFCLFHIIIFGDKPPYHQTHVHTHLEINAPHTLLSAYVCVCWFVYVFVCVWCGYVVRSWCDRSCFLIQYGAVLLAVLLLRRVCTFLHPYFSTLRARFRVSNYISGCVSVVYDFIKHTFEKPKKKKNTCVWCVCVVMMGNTHTHWSQIFAGISKVCGSGRHATQDAPAPGPGAGHRRDVEHAQPDVGDEREQRRQGGLLAGKFNDQQQQQRVCIVFLYSKPK